ncbi:MAG: hypothetical protein Q8O03_01575 [Nanoarchaeota archaeon]|nr:hypothetical protein [Nanoarchaeota archaeon]
MKLPKTFVPEKDLEKKTEEFREGYREVTPEELMKDNMQVIHGDATPQLRIENIENITSKIVNDTFNKKMVWKDYINDHPLFSRSYKAKAVISDYKQEPIIVQVLFRISESKNSGVYGYLYLGNEQGLCMNSFIDYEKIQELITGYFK